MSRNIKYILVGIMLLLFVGILAGIALHNAALAFTCFFAFVAIGLYFAK